MKRCESCWIEIPECQKLCFRCECKKREEEEDKDMKEMEQKDEKFWNIVHER